MMLTKSIIFNLFGENMARNAGTKSSGGSFDEATVDAVWKKATVLPNYPGYATDKCGAIIQKSKHGKTEQYGWEIDHIKPVSKNGTDDLNNLQPLNWENNRSKSDDYPNWSCKITK